MPQDLIPAAARARALAIGRCVSRSLFLLGCGATTAGSIAAHNAFAGDLMQMPGSFAVTTTGAASYSIPIAVPPGTNGMAPVLSLDYTSQAPNGLMGVGWSLSGIPTISRCPETVGSDGTANRVTFQSTTDRFCLEGQKLISTSGTYGAANTTYVTEVNNYNRVISYGVAGTGSYAGPQYFQVWTRSGQVMTFGNITGTGGAGPAVSSTNAAIRSWGLSSIQDVSGNYLKIQYGQPSYLTGFGYGEYYPTEIDYTFNNVSSPQLGAYAAVQFKYAARSDVIDTYQAGAEFRTGAVLTKVLTYANGTMSGGSLSGALVSEYLIAYGNQTDPGTTGRSYVQSVTRCDGSGSCGSPTYNASTKTFTNPSCVAGGTCLPPTTFIWQKGGPIPVTAISTPGTNGSLINYKAYLGDFEGTGRTSILWDEEDNYGRNIGAAGSVIFWMANADGTFRTVSDTTSSGPSIANYRPYIGNFTSSGQADILWVDITAVRSKRE